MQEGLHPRVLVEVIRLCVRESLPSLSEIFSPSLSQGFELAREEALRFLDTFKVETKEAPDRELLLNVARTSLRTKV